MEPDPRRTVRPALPASVLPASVRRARAQWPLLVTVTLTLVVSGTLAALCALLATAGVTSGLAARWQATQEATTVAAYLVMEDDAADQGASALATLRDLTGDAGGDLARPASAWAASPLFYLPGEDTRTTYLLDADTAEGRARLEVGRWPEGGAEVALLRPTADALAVDVGDEFVLAQHAGREPDGGAGARSVVVVGIAAPDRDEEWSRDLLDGEGTGTVLGRIDAFGPLLVAPGTLIDAGEPVARGSVLIAPDLASDPARAAATAEQVGSLRSRAEDALGDGARSVVVQSSVGGEVARGLAEQSVTRSLVLAVLVVVVAVAATALAQVGRALATRRRAEWGLASARGATRWQVSRGAVGEALAAAILAAGMAVALGPALYGALARVPWWPSTAGSSTAGVGAAVVDLLAAVAVGTLVPAGVVASEAWRATGGRREARPAARVAGEVLLVVLAVLGAVQLRAHAPGAGIDPILVLAPGAVLAALVVIALRIVPLAARAADGVMRHLRGAVLALAVWRIARGTLAGAAASVVWAAAALAFAVSVAATWSASQVDQAEAAAGAAVVVADEPGGDTGAAVAAATGSTPAAVLSRPVQLGSRPGAARLVAIDADRAGDVVLGRIDGDDDGDGDGSWSEVMAPLAVADVDARAGGQALTVTDTLALTVTGTAEGAQGYAAQVTPTLVVQAPSGERTLVAADPVTLDGAPQRPALPPDIALPSGGTVVAVSLTFDLVPETAEPPDLGVGVSAAVTIAVNGAPAAGTWSASSVGSASGSGGVGVGDRGTTVAVDGGALVATVGADVLLDPRAWVLLSSFPVPADVPVLASASLAGELGLVEGDLLDLRVGAAAVTARVVGVVAYVPTEPGAPALLADRSTLADALLVAGESGPVVDEWWVGQAGAGASDGVGESDGSDGSDAALAPLSRPVLGALALLAAGAVVLAWAAVGADAAAAARAQGISDARVRALGARRAEVRRMSIVRIVGSTVAAVTVGALAGTGAAVAVAPWIVAGVGGARPVPSVELVTPIAVTLAALAVLGGGATLVGAGLGARAATSSSSGGSRSGGARSGGTSMAGLLRSGGAA